MMTKMMQRLIWKDARTIASLTIAMLASVVMFNLLQLIIAWTMQSRADERLWFAYGIWILLPNLLALGAPALLVGVEEESGSLAWLRTLPAQWNQIIGSKLIVAGVAVMAVFVVGTIGFMVQWTSFPDHVVQQLRLQGIESSQFPLHLLGQAFFCASLLMVSFTTAYWFRSPVSALVAVVPVMGVFAICFFSFEDWLTRNNAAAAPWQELLHRHPWLLMLGGLALLFILLAIHLWSARRRMVTPRSDFENAISERVTREAFRPPSIPMSWYGISLAYRSPSRATALFWQTYRQLAWGLGAALALLLVGQLLAWSHNPTAEFIGIQMVAIGLLLIGAMTFYGDSVRKRCQFLYDRGVSPTIVWATRVGPTLLAMLIVVMATAMALWIGYSSRWQEIIGVAAVLLSFYSLCQLVSLWSPRPILVYFAAPVLAVVGIVTLAPLFSYYDNAVGVLLVTVPLLLYASWRMTPQWMAGNTNRWFTATLAGTLVLGVVLPYVLILGSRWATMPTAQTEWRRQMMATRGDWFDQGRGPLRIANPPFNATIEQMRRMTMAAVLVDEDLSVDERLRMEIEDTEQIGRFVSRQELLDLGRNAQSMLWDPEDDVARQLTPVDVVDDPQWFYRERAIQSERGLLVAKVMAKWSRVIREKALAGDVEFEDVKFADLLSSELANFMTAYLALPDPPNELQEFVEILPQSELAHQSRLASLVTSWKQRQRDPEATLFADKAYASRPKWLAVERIRVDRNLDQALELMLDQIETRGYFADAEKQLRLEELLVKSNVIKERSPRSGYNQALWANQINFARHVDESVALYRSEFLRQAQQE